MRNGVRQLLPNWVEGYIEKDIESITFLERNKGAEKFFEISFELDFPIEIVLDEGRSREIEVVSDDGRFLEIMNFMKHSFRFFADKYKEEYAFHHPVFRLCPDRSEAILKIAMRSKADIIEMESKEENE